MACCYISILGSVVVVLQGPYDNEWSTPTLLHQAAAISHASLPNIAIENRCYKVSGEKRTTILEYGKYWIKQIFLGINPKTIYEWPSTLQGLQPKIWVDPFCARRAVAIHLIPFWSSAKRKPFRVRLTALMMTWKRRGTVDTLVKIKQVSIYSFCHVLSITGTVFDTAMAIYRDKAEYTPTLITQRQQSIHYCYHQVNNKTSTIKPPIQDAP